MMPETEIAACCAVSYSQPVTRWLMGESLHPGGLALTTRLGQLADIGPDSVVLDAGCGQGASTVHLAATTGCRVVGVTLEAEGVAAGERLAAGQGLQALVSFRQGNLLEMPLEAESFDVVLLECVLSILPDKPAALNRFRDALRPGGRLAVTDVTVNGPVPEELSGLLAIAGCVGDARPMSEYRDMIQAVGFPIDHAQDLPETASSFIRDIKGKMLMAEVAAKLGKLPIDGGVIQKAKDVLKAVEDLVGQGTLGYGLLIARKP